MNAIKRVLTKSDTLKCTPQANEKARDAIYKHNNEGESPLFLDLHGLFVREALHYVRIRCEVRGCAGTEADPDCDDAVIHTHAHVSRTPVL